MTIQGLLPYYFMHYRPGTGGKCGAAFITTWRRDPRNVGGFGKGDCRDGTVPPASGAYTSFDRKEATARIVGYLGWRT